MPQAWRTGSVPDLRDADVLSLRETARRKVGMRPVPGNSVTKTENVEVWSCGGGTQSGAIAVLIAQGKLPTPDVAFMSDTGREKSSTWPFVHEFIRPQLRTVGLELTIVKSAEFASLDLFSGSGDALMPGFTNQSGSVGKLSPFCSGRWKVDVGERFLRSLGVVSANNWVGISIDEMQRVRTQHRPWLKLWYPLIFGVPMRRRECVDLIRTVGWVGHIPHSACYMCPNMGDAEWIDMQRNWPGDFAAACAIEAEIHARDPHFFLHQSCIPLGDVDFLAQRSMFPDRGCTSGCFT